MYKECLLTVGWDDNKWRVQLEKSSNTIVYKRFRYRGTHQRTERHLEPRNYWNRHISFFTSCQFSCLISSLSCFRFCQIAHRNDKNWKGQRIKEISMGFFSFCVSVLLYWTMLTHFFFSITDLHWISLFSPHLSFSFCLYIFLQATLTSSDSFCILCLTTLSLSFSLPLLLFLTISFFSSHWLSVSLFSLSFCVSSSLLPLL